MAMLEGFRIQNFGVLKDITIGKLWNNKQASRLTPLVAVIGKNGVGKSTLFDAFGFLADVLKVGVEEACSRKQRSGFDQIISKGVSEPIKFEIYFREGPNQRPITYELSIAKDKKDRPFIQAECLRQSTDIQSCGQPFSFLKLKNGKGEAWKGMSYGEEDSEKVSIELTDNRQLGIATYGVLKEHPRIAVFRNFLKNWYLSYFTPDSAKGQPMAGPQKHLSIRGDNLGNVVQYMERDHKDKFQKILDRIASKIPGIDKIDTKRTDDDRLLLCFNDKGFADPFYAQQMSDGTLKVFAYLLLLEDPTPPPFICIEEPENGLYHKLLETLAVEFRDHATGKKGGSQIFVTTHQPYFVDALSPEETWILEKGADGFSTIRRASDDSVVKAMVDEGLPLGGLWYSDYLDAR